MRAGPRRTEAQICRDEVWDQGDEKNNTKGRKGHNESVEHETAADRGQLLTSVPPPRGESDAHLGFALSVKIMLIHCNLQTDGAGPELQNGCTNREPGLKKNQYPKSQCPI